MAVLVMPLLAGGRDLAAGFIKLLGPVEGGRVVLNANPMSHASTSFTRQLVRSALVDRGAAELVVVGGPTDFVNDVKTAADELGVAHRVRFEADDPELYPGAAAVIVAPDRGWLSTPR